MWEINALLQVLKELNTSGREAIDFNDINFGHCCCKQHVGKKKKGKGEGELERREIAAMLME